MRRALRHVAAFVFCASPVAPAWAGAWALNEGETQIIAGATFSGSTRAFDANGKLIPVASYRKFELGLLVEYGLSERVTLVLKPSLFDVASAGPPAGAYRGIQSLEAGARYQIAKIGVAVFSAQALFKIPGSDDILNSALVGTTAIEAEARLLAAYSFQAFERPGFAEAQIGWRARSSNNPGEARLELTLGARPFESVLFLLQSFNLATTGAGTSSYPAQKSSKLQPSIVYDFASGWSVQAGAFATIFAINARREQGFIAALWRKF